MTSVQSSTLKLELRFGVAVWSWRVVIWSLERSCGVVGGDLELKIKDLCVVACGPLHCYS